MNEKYKTNREITKEWILCGIIFVCMLLLGAYALKEVGKLAIAGIQYAEANRATVECEKWAEEAKVYPEWNEETQTGYYLTPWQKMQCDEFDVEVGAHVIEYKK